jgi:hypothetical protein
MEEVRRRLDVEVWVGEDEPFLVLTEVIGEAVCGCKGDFEVRVPSF